MHWQEKIYFVRELGRSFASIGALIPTSRYAAQAMASEFTRRTGPRTILEAGPGTGSITAEIVRHMGPDDRLVLVELNDGFVQYLRQRLDRDPAFRRVRDQITLLHMDVTKLDRDMRFDVIVSAIPFNNLPPDAVRAIFDTYRALLKPDGVLTYIEYAYLGAIKRRLLSGEQREQIARTQQVLDPLLRDHQFRRDFVLRNVPPAWVRHLRFASPPVEAALRLKPLEFNRRLVLGKAGVSTEAVPWLLGLVLLAILLPVRAVRGVLAVLAAAMIGFFRDPARDVEADDRAAVAACDGTVLRVERVHDERFGEGEWLRIAVFLSLLDVHINRSPIAGKVRDVIREGGGFAAADSAAAEHNEALYTVLDGVQGPCVVAQRTGLVARRIVQWMDRGDLLAQGERFGLIRFGSRTDVYLPAEQWEACVGVGDRVWGGTTVIARLKQTARS
jgi:phosphatidylserine decarboxylase